MSFSNKVVIVTGASSGIGAATAILFANEDANVVMVGRNETKLKNVAAKIESLGKKPLLLKADVSKDDDCKRIINETIEKYGQLDVLVNNAGIVRNGCILDGKVLENYDEVMKTNVRPVINLTMLAAPHLIKTKGNIVNISSVAGIVVKDPLFAAYGVSKAAMDQFTKVSAQELAPSGVRVNSVNPGPVQTEVFENAGITQFSIETIRQNTALDRVSDPEEIAELIMYLAGEKARGITGSIFVTDNGCLVK